MFVWFCFRVVFLAPWSLCVQLSVSGCLTPHEHQELRLVRNSACWALPSTDREKKNQKLNHFLISSRCAPTLAGQWVCGGVPQGALFPAVGVPGGPAADSQRDRISDTENPGRLFITVSWRGETGSSDCWRQVAAICNICLMLQTDVRCRTDLGFTDSTINLQRLHRILPLVFSSCFDNTYGNFQCNGTFLQIVLEQTIILVIDYCDN